MTARSALSRTAWRPRAAALALGACLLGAAVGCATAPRPQAAAQAGSELAAQGAEAYRRGALAEAISAWQRAGDALAAEGRPDERCRVLLRLSQVYLEVGDLKEAERVLADAAALAAPSPELSAEAAGHLGSLHLGLGQPDAAAAHLDRSLAAARAAGRPDLESLALNNQGNVFAYQGKDDEAAKAYAEAARLAGSGTPLAAVAALNAARAARLKGDAGAARRWLDDARGGAGAPAASHGRALVLVDAGLGYRDLRPLLPASREALTLEAATALTEAGEMADALGDARTASYAWGNLGGLYEEAGRLGEARQATERAMAAATRAGAPESLYRWEWQAGRLARADGRTDEAVAAYQRSISALDAIRLQTSNCFGRRGASFREYAGPVYTEFARLLLDRSRGLSDPAAVQRDLAFVRDAVEVLRTFQLQEYFRDDCVGAFQRNTAGIDSVSKTAAVVYFLLLDDRLESIVSTASGLKSYRAPVDAAAVVAEVRAFRQKLEKRTTREYLPHAQRLYDWLLRPLEADLAAAGADTLVVVPDGALRTIPFSALHDGRGFVVDRYAVAVTPSLALTDPRPIPRDDLRVLGVGLTEPVGGFPGLPYVGAELEALQALLPTSVLLNQDFVIPRLQQELGGRPFPIVHIASHAKFESDARQSFLLAYDDRLTVDRLEGAIGLLRFREEPLELLTLSACETAAGDDRAALGLGGVAVKAGARSAVATLWSVHDRASSLLIEEFYRELRVAGTSRGAALRGAQLAIKGDPRYAHPAYWSPFILISNWL